MQTSPSSQSWRPTLLGVLGTTSVILPAFLTGAIAVQVRESLTISESDVGLAIGAFFLGSSCGSAILGRLAERLGPLAAIRLGLGATILADLGIAIAVDGARSLQAFLVVAGLANALTQPAINLLLVRMVEAERLGFVMALKQSGMPAASLLGGLAVPAVALTVGWRAAYVCAAVLAAGAMGLVGGAGETRTTTSATDEPGDPHEPDAVGAGRSAAPTDDRAPAAPFTSSAPSAGAGSPRAGVPDQGWPILLLMAAVGVLGGGAANIIVGYLVSGAVAAGISPGPAGLLLTFGSALGITSRLVHGWLADRRNFDVLARVGVLFVIGSFGSIALMLHTPTAYLLGTPLVFAAGWAWPGLFNLVVVRANRTAPAAATGVTQTGVYVGSFVSPVLAGLLIEWSGYRAAWILTAASLAGAAVLAALVRFSMGSGLTEQDKRPSMTG